MQMWLKSKFCKTFVLLALFSCVSESCPYAEQFLYDDLSNIYNDYMSSASYDTYETDCHHFVSQPPSIPKAIVEHALNSSVHQTNSYISFNTAAAEGHSTSKFLTDMDQNNYFFESATKYVQQTTCSSKNTTTMYLPTLQVEKFHEYMTEDVTKVACEGGRVKFPTCLPTKYRELDGTCNNLQRPIEGRAGDCKLHILPSDYRDGISEFRSSIDGSPLPNPRILSTNFFGDDDKRPLSSQFTQFQGAFGETIVSDVALSLSYAFLLQTNILLSCDHDERKKSDHPEYAGVPLPQTDSIKKIYPKQTCMPFVRTIPCARCRLGPRMQVNLGTSALDLSAVYGLSTTMSNARRTMVGGRLKSQTLKGQEIFAVERLNSTGRFRCFEGKCERSPADVRNIIAPTGQLFYLLFHRNHNRHARKLEKIQPFWNDEQLFQEARKWNIAESQHCLYNEYLSTWIGQTTASYFGILPKPIGHYTKYNPDAVLKTILEFQTTAGRSGHAAISEDLYMIDRKTGRESKVNFRHPESFERIFYDGRVDDVYLAQISKPAFETTYSIPFKTFLFNFPGRTFGVDLGTLDIQRQRDHGIPGYIHYLKYFHDVEVRSWQDLLKFIDSKDIQKLKKFYKYVEDVELYVGGKFERKLTNSLVGPTFAQIIGIQFHNVKYADRFFYEHENQIGSFTIEQLNEIKTKTSFASILCKNTELKKMLRDPLRLMSKTNQFVSCSEFDDIDYKINFRKSDCPNV